MGSRVAALILARLIKREVWRLLKDGETKRYKVSEMIGSLAIIGDDKAIVALRRSLSFFIFESIIE